MAVSGTEWSNNGLGALGTNPINLLRRRVPGYGQIGDTLGDSAF